LNPNNAVAYGVRGDAYSKKNDYDKAIADYSQAIKLNPNNAVGYGIRGDAYYKKNDYDKAIADYSQAIKLDPNNAVGYGMRGRAYGKKGDYDRAIADISQAIRLGNSGAYCLRGLLYYNKHDYDQAIADLNQAIKLDTNDNLAYKFRGFAYFYKGYYDQAITDLSQSIKLNPNDETVRETLEEAQREITKNDKFLTDNRDGKKYRTVAIGKQIWMADNLNYKASNSKCYENETLYCDKYGRLYNWNTARVVCPKGWHLPSDAEWNVLMKSINPTCYPKAQCANAGKLLKAKSDWNDNGNGVNIYEFSALPGGGGGSGSNGVFGGVGNNGFWWSFSEESNSSAYYIYMGHKSDDVISGWIDKSFLFSVRCLQD